MLVFGVILGVFPAFSLIRTTYGLKYLSVFSTNAGKWGKNADQNNSKYELFLLSANASDFKRGVGKFLGELNWRSSVFKNLSYWRCCIAVNYISCFAFAFHPFFYYLMSSLIWIWIVNNNQHALNQARF